MNICIVLVSIAALFGSANAGNSKEFVKEVTMCCQRGFMEARGKQNPNCAAIALQSNGAISGLICRTAAELCCLKKLQEGQCDRGTSVAINGGTCSAQPAGREDHQECCYCCYLGMKSKKKSMGCRGAGVLGIPCEKAFMKCCLLPDPHPDGIPYIFGTVGPTTSIRRNTCSGLGCAQSCEIRNGSPTCTCRDGFQLNSNGRTCDDKNECLERGACGQDEICKNRYGSYECSPNNRKVTCPTGHEVDSSGKQCQDINECERSSPCQADEICVNVRGSYNCKARCPSTYVFRNNRCERPCRTGYRYDGIRCVDDDECQRSGTCRRSERCVNTVGSYRCEVRRALKCRRGFVPDERTGTKCVDQDECVVYGKRVCGTKTCINVPGSYRCVHKCTSGYSWDSSTSTCIDIDECRTLKITCQKNAVCENIPGSYRCKCKNGYYSSGRRCYDIDECRQNLCGADEICFNKPGTYRCEKRRTCRPGYILRRGTCVDVDECLNRRICSADEICINTAGSYECKVKCSRGYERVGDDCKDIDECSTGNYNCRADLKCQNIPGSYRCMRVQRCPSGYELFNRQCIDKNECQDPNACRPPRPNCVNLVGTYRCDYSACPQGFERNRYGQCGDIDECARGTHICLDRAEQCINVNGTYSCRCNPGYIRTGSDQHCRDKNECRGPDQFCAHKCVNTEGSFKCECRPGYRLVGATNCLDINECYEGNAKCQHSCRNTQGSYYCQCRQGYTLSSNKVSCRDINECNSPEVYGRCAYRCENNPPGSFTCSCPSGFQPRYSGRYCRDIDECVTGTSRCGSGTCINTKGGFECIRARCPNSQYYIKRSPTHCARKACPLNDARCRSDTRKSIRWHGRGLPNNARPGAFSYLYNITTSGYRVKPTIKFTIKRGNVGNVFRVYSLGYGKSLLKNVVVLKGPRRYQLEYVGEVIDTGVVRASFVTNLNIWVSRYEFF